MNELVRNKRAVTLVDMPRPVGTAIIRGKTGAEVMRKLKRKQRLGYIAAASPLARVSGGGFAVKVTLLKPLPAPVPGWAKGVAIVGIVLMGLGIVSVFILNALASMFTAAAAIPWGVVAGGAIVFLIVAALAIRLLRGGSINISQNIHF